MAFIGAKYDLKIWRGMKSKDALLVSPKRENLQFSVILTVLKGPTDNLHHVSFLI